MNRAREYGEYTSSLEEEILKGWHPPYIKPVIRDRKVRDHTAEERQFLAMLRDTSRTPSHRLFAMEVSRIIDERRFQELTDRPHANHLIAMGQASVAGFAEYFATEYQNTEHSVDVEEVVLAAKQAVNEHFGVGELQGIPYGGQSDGHRFDANATHVPDAFWTEGQV